MNNELISATIQEAIELASKDYDAFWMWLSEQDRELTRSLCYSETHDTVVVDGDDVWVVTEVGVEFEPQHQGSVNELVLYVNCENTGLSEDELESFRDALQYEVGDHIAVEIGQNVAAEWLHTNDQIERAWDEAMQSK